MQTKLCPHWIPTHQDARDEQWLSGWRPPFVKIVSGSDESMPCLDVALRVVHDGGLVILRSHPISENWDRRGIMDRTHAMTMAREHVAKYGVMLNDIDRQYGPVDRSRLLLEGLNEPHEWADEPAELTAMYYAEFIKQAAISLGVLTVSLNLGVGWPGNHSVTDAPPDWTPYEPVFEAREKYGGYIGTHEYWYVDGPSQNWGWWAGRLLACPWQAPWLVTECGLDAHVAGVDYFGYKGLAPNEDEAANKFVMQLGDYDLQMQRHEWVEGLFPFTWDFGGPEWATFSYRNQIWVNRFYQHLEWLGSLDKLPEAYDLPDYRTDVPWVVPQEPDPIPDPITTWGAPTLTPWKSLVDIYAAEYGLDPLVVGTIIMVESNGAPDAFNPDSWATGLMQVVSVESGEEWAKDRPTKEALFDPEINIAWGCRILADNLARYGDLARALAAYYGGDNAANNLDGDAAKLYIRRFRKWWADLWETEPPVMVGEPDPPPTNIPVANITTLRWNAEEAVRDIERIQQELTDVRTRLTDLVIVPAYDIELEG